MLFERGNPRSPRRNLNENLVLKAMSIYKIERPDQSRGLRASILSFRAMRSETLRICALQSRFEQQDQIT